MSKLASGHPVNEYLEENKDKEIKNQGWMYL